jgi:hypothetical protein
MHLEKSSQAALARVAVAGFTALSSAAACVDLAGLPDLRYETAASSASGSDGGAGGAMSATIVSASGNGGSDAKICVCPSDGCILQTCESDQCVNAQLDVSCLLSASAAKRVAGKVLFYKLYEGGQPTTKQRLESYDPWPDNSNMLTWHAWDADFCKRMDEVYQWISPNKNGSLRLEAKADLSLGQHIATDLVWAKRYLQFGQWVATTFSTKAHQMSVESCAVGKLLDDPLPVKHRLDMRLIESKANTPFTKGMVDVLTLEHKTLYQSNPADWYSEELSYFHDAQYGYVLAKRLVKRQKPGQAQATLMDARLEKIQSSK